MRYALNPGASEDDLNSLRKQFPMLSNDYLAFLANSDGGEGFVGLAPGYFQLWRASEVARYSSEYEVQKYLPGYLAIGSDGGGDLYVLPVTGSPPGLFIVPAIGMEAAAVESVAGSFSAFASAFGKDRAT
ncbi:MAG: SMI1/KNR4 family protein [Burkholderiales bacterium]